MVYSKIKGRMAELKKSQRKVAQELGLSTRSYNLKINGKRPFTIPEAEKLITILNLSNPAEYFFNV
jgi:transcriptional regulator with XRE-family HTH domain